MKRLVLMLLAAALVQGASAQGVKKQTVLADGSRELTTSECCYARGGGIFARRQMVAMSHLVTPSDSTAWCIIMPMNLKKRCEVAEGSSLVLKLQNGGMVELHCAQGVKKGDNYEELNHTFTISPRYAISEEQINQLSQWEVESIGMETSRGNVGIARQDYRGEWRFSSMVQRCHNVLKWKLDELRQQLLTASK